MPPEEQKSSLFSACGGWLSGAFCLLLLAFIWNYAQAPASERGPSEFQVHRIAHAGGGYNKHRYTNSYDALNLNIKNGFVYFEIDFVFTSDGELVCLHDWDSSFSNSFGFTAGHIPDLAEFERLAGDNPLFTNCTLDGLADWMELNSGTTIITDIKGNNMRGLRKIRSTLPDAARRVIPQIYQAQNFAPVKAMGFQQIIWTLYRYRGHADEVLRRVREFDGAVAVTMPERRAQAGLAGKLRNLGVPTYVHTINSARAADRYLEFYSVSEIYTDFLVPE